MVVGSSMLVAFLTGITEPLEFTFLFAAPLLFYLIYVPLSGFSYMFMELSGAHVGVGFARGFIDLMVYGALPVLKGTQFYWAFVLAAGEGIFAFLTFWFCIKKFNISTPGRGDNAMKLMTKKDYNQIKNVKDNPDGRILEIIKLLGGKENLKDVSACATRLRVSVIDSQNIKKESFNNLGSKGMVINNNALQIIFGGEATILSDKINDYLNGQNSNLNNKETIKFIYEKEPFTQFGIYAPFDGEVCELESVPDDLLSKGIIGRGIAMKPTSLKLNKIYSPIDGYLLNIFPTKHAYSFESKDGTELLLHIGIDTVENCQDLFSVKSIVGKVNLDSNILVADFKKINNKAKSTITPIVFPDLDNDKEIILEVNYGEVVKAGDLIMTIKK